MVLYSGSYWLAAAFTPPNTNIGITPGTNSFYWASFGATFDSVATNILFAQDVYANQTINIGSDGANPVIALNADAANNNANPYISINKPSYSSNTSGIFLGFDNGTPKINVGDDSAYLK